MVATLCTAVGGSIIAGLTAPVSVPGLIAGTAVTTAASCLVYKAGDTLDEGKKAAEKGQELMEYAKIGCLIIIIAVCVCSFVYLAKNY